MPPHEDVVAIDATETAVQLAEENGVNLADVKGSGTNGRIIKRDVEAFLDNQDEETTVAAPIPPAPPEPEPEPIDPNALVWVRLVGAKTAMLGSKAVLRDEAHRVPFGVYERARSVHPGKFAVKYPGTAVFVNEG